MIRFYGRIYPAVSVKCNAMDIHYSLNAQSILDVLQIPKGITCFVGSGGKTTLIRAITYELCKTSKVIVSTTTKMYPPEEIDLCDDDIGFIKDRLDHAKCICVGKRAYDGKITSSGLSVPDLKAYADYVLIEADGAKRFPLKMPNKTEPVYTEKVSKIVCVAGLSGIGRTFIDACFRSDVALKSIGREEKDVIQAEDISNMICNPDGILWNAPENVSVTVVYNQADTNTDRQNADKSAALLNNCSIDSVVVSSLRKDFGGKYARFC